MNRESWSSMGVRVKTARGTAIGSRASESRATGIESAVIRETVSIGSDRVQWVRCWHPSVGQLEGGVGVTCRQPASSHSTGIEETYTASRSTIEIPK